MRWLRIATGVPLVLAVLLMAAWAPAFTAQGDAGRDLAPGYVFEMASPSDGERLTVETLLRVRDGPTVSLGQTHVIELDAKATADETVWSRTLASAPLNLQIGACSLVRDAYESVHQSSRAGRPLGTQAYGVGAEPVGRFPREAAREPGFWQAPGVGLMAQAPSIRPLFERGFVYEPVDPWAPVRELRVVLKGNDPPAGEDVDVRPATMSASVASPEELRQLDLAAVHNGFLIFRADADRFVYETKAEHLVPNEDGYYPNPDLRGHRASDCLHGLLRERIPVGSAELETIHWTWVMAGPSFSVGRHFEYRVNGENLLTLDEVPLDWQAGEASGDRGSGDGQALAGPPVDSSSVRWGDFWTQDQQILGASAAQWEDLLQELGLVEDAAEDVRVFDVTTGHGDERVVVVTAGRSTQPKSWQIELDAPPPGAQVRSIKETSCPVEEAAVALRFRACEGAAPPDIEADWRAPAQIAVHAQKAVEARDNAMARLDLPAMEEPHLVRMALVAPTLPVYTEGDITVSPTPGRIMSTWQAPLVGAVDSGFEILVHDDLEDHGHISDPVVIATAFGNASAPMAMSHVVTRPVASTAPQIVLPVAPTVGLLSLTVAVVAVGARLVGAWKAGAAVPLGAALYSRTRPHAAADDGRRSSVLQMLQERPGRTVAELARDLGWSRSAVQHHLDVLRRAEFVVDVRIGERVAWFDRAQHGPKERKRLAAMRRAEWAAFLEAVDERPGITGAELAQVLGRATWGVSRTGAKLVRLGVIQRERDGNRVRFRST